MNTFTAAVKLTPHSPVCRGPHPSRWLIMRGLGGSLGLRVPHWRENRPAPSSFCLLSPVSFAPLECPHCTLPGPCHVIPARPILQLRPHRHQGRRELGHVPQFAGTMGPGAAARRGAEVHEG